jgi:PPOX class probable F420-dependent enzyme
VPQGRDDRGELTVPEIPASHRDLLESNPIVILATAGADGFPQVTATWFLLEDDGTVKLSLNTARQKTRNLQRNPEATLFFVDPANPYRTLEIRARASVAPDPDYDFADRFSAKYGGADLRAMDQPGEERVVVSFTPVKVNTFGESPAAATATS